MATDPKTLEYRNVNNLCPRDGRPNKSGRKMCEYCLKKSAEKTERHRQKKKVNGLCLSCGGKVDNEKFCDKCKSAIAVTSHNSHIKRYGQRKQSGLCVDCNQPAESDKTMCTTCLQRRSDNQKTKRDNSMDNHLCVQCNNDLGDLEGKRCQICIDKRNGWYQGSTTQEKDTQRRKDRREAVLEHYGGRCACCGEDEQCFLAIDHTDGEGNTHRKEINKYGSTFFKWLIDKDFPEGFQVLCHNCNMGKHLNGGKCPHVFRNGRSVITREMRKNLPCPFPESEKQL